MGLQNRVLEAAAGHPIPAGPRGVAVQGKLSFLPEGEESPEQRDHLMVVSERSAREGYNLTGK